MNGTSGASRKMRNACAKCEKLYAERLSDSAKARATHRNAVQKGRIAKVTHAIIFKSLKAGNMRRVDQKAPVAFDEMSTKQAPCGL